MKAVKVVSSAGLSAGTLGVVKSADDDGNFVVLFDDADGEHEVQGHLRELVALPSGKVANAGTTLFVAGH